MLRQLERQVDLTPLVVFRVLFGLVLCYATVRYAQMGWIESVYIEPNVFFPYYGWEWLPRPTALGMYVLFGGMLVGAIGIALGALYRFSAVLFAICFIWVELLDKTNYLNHYYFVSLAALVMVFLPANRKWSVDVALRPHLARDRAPQWMSHAPRFLLSMVYLYAGLAKINTDWVVHAEPLSTWLPQHGSLPMVGPLLDQHWTAFAFSWGGLLFDLLVPFALWMPRWRPWAYAAVLGFHAITGWLFPIGVFPLMMVLCTLCFFPAENYRALLERFGVRTATSSGDFRFSAPVMRWTRVGFGALAVFLVVYPFRFLAYPGDVFWNEEGYRFSWRVMLMEKAGHAFFFVKALDSPGEQAVHAGSYLTPNQEKQMATQPDMILQFAHWLADHYAAAGVKQPKVRAEVWVELNGRGSQLFIDPYVDLAAESDGFGHKPWIIPRDSVVTFDDLESQRMQWSARHDW